MRAIAVYGSRVPAGFNIEAGGMNAPMSDETKAKLSVAKTGSRLDESTKDKLRITSAKMWASKTPEQRAHTSAMLSAALKGRTHKEDHKEKLSEVRKTMFASGKLLPVAGFKGKKHSEETKEKMRLARTGRRHTAEDKEKMRLQALERWQNEEYRNNVLAAKGYK